MNPTIGRIVHFRLTSEQAVRVNARRAVKGEGHGNHANEGQVFPLIVTAVWPQEFDPAAYESEIGVNGQVLLDGDDSLWVTSAPQHVTLPGCWFWPPREP